MSAFDPKRTFVALGHAPESQDEADALGILRHSISGFVDPNQPHD